MSDLSLKAQEREIDGVTYKAWPLSFGVGRPALVRLLGIVSPMLSSMLAGTTKQQMSAALFGALPSSLSDGDLTYFAKLFGDVSQYKTADGNWAPLIDKVQGAHFEDRYLAYFYWLGFCCEVSFASFFTGIKGDAKSADQVLTETLK